ncbi:MAG: DEAD/DEAH box helicase family protein [Chloroflexota bacterium]
MTDDFAARLGQFGSSKYEELRDSQAHVLDTYARQYANASDVAIELPTGVGKTLIALLLADHALDRGWSVAYLAGSNVLAEQVEVEARELGLDAHRFWGGHYPGAALDDYHQGQALGIMNYWVYFNSSPKVDAADMVIFDDAHLAEQPLTSMYSTRISRAAYTQLYVRLCDIVHAHTSAYETLEALRDGTAPWSAPPELLAFNDWAGVAAMARDAIDDSAFAEADEGRFAWRELRSRLERCGVLIGPSAIEIRPYHSPSQIFSGVSRAKQRIYMSATLGTMDDLERRLGIGPITRIEVPPELHAGSTGHRLFVVNPTAEVGPMQPLTDLVLELAGEQHRVAWLCASHQEADQVQGALGSRNVTCFRLRPGDDSALEEWRGHDGGHLIAAGRFDGLDFAGDICRFVIMPSIPAASSEFERFVVAYLGDATFMRHRIGQRVTQALGRANRLPSDWAIYLGLDPGFAGVLAQPAVRGAMDVGVSSLVRQALELHSEGMDSTEQALRSFWTGDRTDPTVQTARRPGRVAAGTAETRSGTDEVRASTALWLGDFEQAAKQAADAAALLEQAGEAEHGAFWRYVESHARFAAGGPRAMAAAKSALTVAVENGPRTAWFVRLRRTLADLEGHPTPAASNEEVFLTWDSWLRESRGGVQRGLTRARTMLEGSHNERAEALLTLGRLAGVASDRPGGSSATDVRWAWVAGGEGQRRMWEVKTGDRSQRVPRSDLNQLLGQIQVESQDHPRARVSGCLLTVLTEMEDDAAVAAREKVAVLHEGAVCALFDYLADRMLEYGRLWRSGTAAERGAARSTVEPKLPTGDWLRRLLAPSGGRVLTRDSIVEVFQGLT